MKTSSWRPYIRFKTLKQPTSRGWGRGEEWAGRQMVIILFSRQYSSKEAETWLSWPSRTIMRQAPFRRTIVCSSKCLIHCIAVLLSVQPFGEVLTTQGSGILVPSYHDVRWFWPWTIRNGGTTKPSLLTHSIAVAHSRLPACNCLLRP